MKICAVAAGLMVWTPACVWADTAGRSAVFQFDIETASNSRGGSDLNSSGFLPFEIPDYDLTAIDAQVALPLPKDITLQFGLRHDVSHAPTTVAIFPSNDSYRSGTLASLQLGQQLGSGYGGAFLATGSVQYNPADADQNADVTSFGIQGARHWENVTVGGLFGTLNTSADNPETLTNATFFGLTGSYYFGNARTRLSGSYTMFNGEQDVDSASPPDPVAATLAGVEIEHAFVTRGSYQVAGYLGFDHFDIRETSSTGSRDTITDDVVSLGLRVTFGASAPHQRDRAMTPALPDMLRLLGAVPAVD